jgi:hypothetical protein
MSSHLSNYIAVIIIGSDNNRKRRTTMAISRKTIDLVFATLLKDIPATEQIRLSIKEMDKAPAYGIRRDCKAANFIYLKLAESHFTLFIYKAELREISRVFPKAKHDRNEVNVIIPELKERDVAKNAELLASQTRLAYNKYLRNHNLK